jgi:hypothetical protein
MSSRRHQNTVQPQAVNLANAEPCPNPGTALFFAGPVARNPPLWRTRMQTKRLSHPAPAAKGARLRIGQETMNDIDPPGQSPGPQSDKTIEAEAGNCATLCANGTGSRAMPWFEGAHLVRRCAPELESAHLGKSREFLRGCALVFEDAQFSVRIFATKPARTDAETNLPGHSPGPIRQDDRGRSQRLRDFTRKRHRVQGGALVKALVKEQNGWSIGRILKQKAT